MANQSYTYSISLGRNLDGLISAVRHYLFSEENMEVQELTDEQGNKLLQARAKGGKWKQFMGMDKAIVVRFMQNGSAITMELGQAKWIDKGAIMSLSMFVLWPLAVTSGIGIYNQRKLPKRIKQAADIYMGVTA